MEAGSGPAFWQLALAIKTSTQNKGAVCGSNKTCGIFAAYFTGIRMSPKYTGLSYNSLCSLSGNEQWMEYPREAEKRLHLPVTEQSDVICVCNLCKSGLCLCDFSLLLQLLWEKSSEIYAQCTAGKALIWQNRTADLISILCEDI